MTVLRYLFFVTLTMTMLMGSQNAYAYEEDTHFMITYVICRSVGFTAEEALTVAAVDQGMDDSLGTVANDGAEPHVEEEWLWHALDKDGKMNATGIIKRKQYMFDVAATRPNDKEKLLYLGAFFHYAQDTWAHRHHYDGQPHSIDKYTTYNTPLGHARHGHQPDRPPFDPVAALMNIEDGVVFAQRFLKDVLHRNPTPFLANYQPTGGKQDGNWKDKRDGKYFHQLVVDAPANSPKRFLQELIRAQINAYGSSIDANPFFLGRYTADEANFEKVRKALQTVCQSYSAQVGNITIPSKKDKEGQGYNKLTTSSFAAARQ